MSHVFKNPSSDDLLGTASFGGGGGGGGSHRCRTVFTGVTAAIGSRVGGSRGAIGGTVVRGPIADRVFEDREINGND